MNFIRWSPVLAILLGLGLASAESQAQQPPVKKFHTNKTTFKLPIQVGKNTNIKEVLLYMKEASGQWELKDWTTPAASHFTCHVPHDGEYWFTLVTVDKKGGVFPADLSRTAPHLIVVVDSGNAAASGAITETAPAEHVSPAAVPDRKYVVNDTPPEPRAPMAQSPTMHSAPMRSATGGRLVNNTQVSVDYNVAKVGPSGIGRIEIYATPDNGQTWQRVGEDTGARSPAEVNLPGEGVWGIKLVATNGNGLGGRAPVAGDKPGSSIEVDLTAPQVHSMEIDPITKRGSLEIRWKMSDKNLGHDPVNLYHGPSPNGPWQPMAMKIKNEGRHAWQFPRDVNPQFYVRLEAFDLAGNVTRFDLRDPVVLDTTEPDLNIINISPVQGRGSVSSAPNPLPNSIVPVIDRQP